ncbi:dynactin p62 family-domain-containing protein [Mycena maculata]|uniref:Dynactin subunit 4 n=1 Tax=Mycena maculata TaxID=230809 RepID=A0AAD7NEZ0_9AGAR|nr:dynactin p62 family-domain-containing protein [Mycena maculata]
MPPTVDYHCPCLSRTTVPPPPHLPSSSHSFHALHTLFFCEECDAVRCNRCVSVEVSGYYCPNCLFEVPSASVRAEKNRCARNCFMCPNCRNTLSVVPSDPPDPGDGRLTIPISTIGEPPFFLYCNHCRWDSAEVGITFEKPTGLAAQLQKFEDSAPDSLEFERLKEHFEPVIRASSLSSSTSTAPAAHPSSAAHSHRRTNSITAAASAALARDIPGVSKYNPLARSGRGGSSKDKTANRDEMPEYRSRLDISSASSLGTGGGDADVDSMRHLENVSEVANLEQRWVNSWATSLQTADLKPLRIPLHSKRSKRCPACAHILIKPEQKAQSVRYKIKLVAANYLPAITAALPHQQEAANPDAVKRTLGKSTTVAADDDRATAGMHAGKTYPFHLALTNPLYDPIQVRLTVQRVHAPAPASGRASPEKARRPPFAVSLPSASFPIAAFAEAWEYEDDEDDDMFGLDDDDEFGIAGRVAGREKDTRGKIKTVGVLEKKANVTVVGGEVVIGKEARGNVKFNMLVSYTYRSDDPTPSESNDAEGTVSKAAASKPPETKTFAFYTVVDLGPIIPREEPRVESDF